MDGRITIPWKTGGGNIVLAVSGEEVRVSSDTANARLAREQVVTFRAGEATATLTVVQKGARVVLRDNAGKVIRDNEGRTLTVLRDGRVL